MAIGISVTGDALLGYVVTVTDADQGDLVHVYRVDQTGHYEDAIVRELDMATPTGDTMVVIDYEAPFNVDLKYVAEAYTSDVVIGTATSGIVGTTLPYGFAIISDPLEESQRIAVAIESLPDWKYETRVLGKHQVLRRKNPVMNLDLESGRSGSLTFTNLNLFAVDWDGTGPYVPYDLLDNQTFKTVFASGRKLLFRNDWRTSGFDDLYFACTSRSVSMASGDLAPAGEIQFLRYQVEFLEQDRPGTAIAGSGLGNWNAVDTANDSWDDVKAKHSNWFSVLVNPSL